MSKRFDHALKHVSMLGYQDGDRVLLRAIDRNDLKPARNFEFVYPNIPTDQILGFEQEGYGIHIVINGANKKADVTQCRSVFYEHDSVNEKGRDRLLEYFPDAVFESKPVKDGVEPQWYVPKYVQSHLWYALNLPEPTMQVDTGGKSIHNYWAFLEPINPQLWVRLQQDILEFSDGDRQIAKLSQTMRLAGSRHESGNFSKLVGGTGNQYGFDELRAIVPKFEKPVKASEGAITYQQFLNSFRFPIPESVPLDRCLIHKTRELLQEGAQPGSRSNTAFRLACDLQSAVGHLFAAGQRFDGDPYEMFLGFCQKCPSEEGWNQREWDAIWKSAQSEARKSYISPEAVENCVKGWAWDNCPNKVVQTLPTSKIAKPLPPVGSVEIPSIDESKSDEDRLRDAIANYNTILNTGNQFQAIPYRRWIQKTFEISVGEVDQLAKILQRGQQSELLGLWETMPSISEQIESRSLGAVMPGLACGFYDLDAMTQGFQRSDMILIAARPAMGKTSFVLNIAKSVATYHKLPVALFSLEMQREKLAYRLLSGEAQIETGRLRSGRIAAHEWERLGHAIASLSEAQIYVDDTPGITVEEIRTKVRALSAAHGLGMIIIDYLQIMGGTGENRVLELSKITRELKTIAREFNVPVIALSQLSRGVESRTNKRPMMSDLRESGSLEQDADLIVMLYRDEYYNPDTPDRGVAEVIITKHRDGPTGTVRLLFDPQFTQFKNLALPREGYVA